MMLFLHWASWWYRKQGDAELFLSCTIPKPSLIRAFLEDPQCPCYCKASAASAVFPTPKTSGRIVVKPVHSHGVYRGCMGLYTVWGLGQGDESSKRALRRLVSLASRDRISFHVCLGRDIAVAGEP